MGRRFYVWLELTSDDSHDEFRRWGDRLREDFGAELYEEYPMGYHKGGKEYWRYRLNGQELLLMRKSGTALGGRDVDLLVQIATRWSVSKRAGWRWFIWDIRSALKRVGFIHCR
jgi:hypothetical protein